jgi:hypothetical protein
MIISDKHLWLLRSVTQPAWSRIDSLTALGIIFSLSLLIAAGIAIYDNPQVREWIDERRRKIALAFDGSFEDSTSSSFPRRSSQYDASTREDDSPEAVERRRQAREEIMQRGAWMQRRRTQASTSSFDEMVDSGGRLREKDFDTEGTRATMASATDQIPGDGLRKRVTEISGISQGSALANPFDDELGMGIHDEKAALEYDMQQGSRERSTTLVPNTPPRIDTEMSSTPRPDDTMSPQDSEHLVNLTPTTSVAPSTTLLSDSGVLTPTSVTHPVLSQETSPTHEQMQPSSFQTIQEWASTASTAPASFYSPPQSEHNFQSVAGDRSRATSTTASVIATNEGMSEAGDLGVDAMSEDDHISTPSSWSEVGSVFSAE